MRELRVAAPGRRSFLKSAVGLTVFALAGLSWYAASLLSEPVDAASLTATIDLEQQLAPRHFVLQHGQSDGLLQPAAVSAGAFPVERVVEVRRGDTLMGLLVEAGIARDEAHQAVTALEEVFAPEDLKAGQEVTLNLRRPDPAKAADRQQQLVELRLQPSVEQNVQVSRAEDGGFVAAALQRPLTPGVEVAAAIIQSSLFEAGQAQGVPLPAMAEVIRAFSYDVDFQRDIQPGDAYEIVFEQYRDEEGAPAKTGDVLYAALVLSGRRHEIYRFAPADGRPDYFTPKGESIRKALLRTPIDGARMSSGFGMRKHPILGYSKMHKGVDFAASTGTPIFAAGDGTIAQIGRNGAYGNYIRLRHNAQYSTAYAHVSRFAKGLKKGSRVRQGDVIAYVGSTGRSTGPHLHYEVLAEGRQINPVSVQLPTGLSLEGKELEAFQTAKAKIDRQRTDASNRLLIAETPAAD